MISLKFVKIPDSLNGALVQEGPPNGYFTIHAVCDEQFARKLAEDMADFTGQAVRLTLYSNCTDSTTCSYGVPRP